MASLAYAMCGKLVYNPELLFQILTIFFSYNVNKSTLIVDRLKLLLIN